VVEILAAVLEAAGRPAGRIGTLGYRFGDRGFDGEALEGLRTTPEASDLFAVLRRMRAAGAEAVAMEVSSHALALHRVAGARFDVALFTNLTRDHFDFHRDFDDYFAAKRRLFDHLKRNGRPVVNVDDPYGRRLAEELPRVLTFGSGGDVAAREVELDTDGIRGTLVTPRGDLPFATSLLGRFNLENVIAAAAAAEALGLPHDAVVEALAACRPLPGRLEPVVTGLPFGIYVDYAHTDAALAAAIGALADFGGGQVIAVFGCGGDRDPGKRELMGRAAGSLAALPIVTTDNPRREDPLEIIAAVEQGLKRSGNTAYRIIPDRREAIRMAIAHAAPGWSVLIAGKGHEEVQVVGERELPFSDRDEVRLAVEERFGARAGG
jgi:UDP-N-acetylmuramoyl-L-alanyl-D-glutamate--2,6-diaminopimelate ligase